MKKIEVHALVQQKPPVCGFRSNLRRTCELQYRVPLVPPAIRKQPEQHCGPREPPQPTPGFLETLWCESPSAPILAIFARQAPLRTSTSPVSALALLRASVRSKYNDCFHEPVFRPPCALCMAARVSGNGRDPYQLLDFSAIPPTVTPRDATHSQVAANSRFPQCMMIASQ